MGVGVVGISLGGSGLDLLSNPDWDGGSEPPGAPSPEKDFFSGLDFKQGLRRRALESSGIP